MMQRRLGYILTSVFILLWMTIGWANAQSQTGLPCVEALKKTKAASPRQPETRFVVFGDNGSGTPYQEDIARQMWRHFQQNPFQLALMTGDNFYFFGNVNRYGDCRFLAPYRELISRSVCFLPTLGNHDVGRPVGNSAPFFRSYRQEQVRFFGIGHDYYDYKVNDIHFVALNTNTYQAGSAQAQWLQRTLNDNDCQAGPCRWRIVYGHHPMYSSGKHGSTARLIRDLKPVLERYQVHLYISGHDHAYERYGRIPTPLTNIGLSNQAENPWQVVYLVSGGGGGDLYPFKKPCLPGLQHRRADYHFVSFAAVGETLQLSAINRDGEPFDQVTYHTGPVGLQPTTPDSQTCGNHPAPIHYPKLKPRACPAARR